MGNLRKMEKNLNIDISEYDGSISAISFLASSISNSEQIASVTQQIIEYVQLKHTKYLVFDFAEVKFFSSQALGLLLNVRSKVQAYGGNIFISGIDPKLYRIFKITNLDRIFDFYPDKKTAIGEIQSEQNL